MKKTKKLNKVIFNEEESIKYLMLHGIRADSARAAFDRYWVYSTPKGPAMDIVDLENLVLIYQAAGKTFKLKRKKRKANMEPRKIYVVMCLDCTEKEMSGKSSLKFANDYAKYWMSTGLKFTGCEHLSIVEKEAL